MSELTFNEEKFQEMMDRLCDAVPDDVSSIEELSMYYDIFKKGYRYAVDKACEWLKEHLGVPAGIPQAKSYNDAIHELTTEFRKGMEE